MIRTLNTMFTWHDRGAAFCSYVCVKLVPEHPMLSSLHLALFEHNLIKNYEII